MSADADFEWEKHGEFEVAFDVLGSEVDRRRLYACSLCGVVERSRPPVSEFEGAHPLPLRWVFLADESGAKRIESLACGMCKWNAKRGLDGKWNLLGAGERK